MLLKQDHKKLPTQASCKISPYLSAPIPSPIFSKAFDLAIVRASVKTTSFLIRETPHFSIQNINKMFYIIQLQVLTIIKNLTHTVTKDVILELQR